MTTTEKPEIKSTLRTGEAAALMGVCVETLCRWTAQADDRGVALRRARLSRGRYSTASLREAKLLT